MVRFGILGAGFMGHAHIDGLLANGPKGVEYTTVCDIDKKKCDAFAAQYGLKALYDFDEMLNDEGIDVIDLCLPSSMHEAFTVKTANAKKHILVEKPIAFTLEAAKNMYAAARENEVKLMVAHPLRFWPEYVKIKELVDNGTIGNVISVSAQRLGQAPDWAAWYRDPNISGETLFNLTIHDIDYVHHLFGKPASVYSAGTKDEYECYNDVMNIFKFKNGTNVLVDGSMSMTPGYPFTMYIRLLGDKGTIEFSYKAGVNIGAGAIASLKLFIEGQGASDIEFEPCDAYGAEVQYFADCVRDDKEPELVSEESVLTVLRSLIKAKESLNTGEVYEL